MRFLARFFGKISGKKVTVCKYVAFYWACLWVFQIIFINEKVANVESSQQNIFGNCFSSLG